MAAEEIELQKVYKRIGNTPIEDLGLTEDAIEELSLVLSIPCQDGLLEVVDEMLGDARVLVDADRRSATDTMIKKIIKNKKTLFDIKKQFEFTKSTVDGIIKSTPEYKLQVAITKIISSLTVMLGSEMDGKVIFIYDGKDKRTMRRLAKRFDSPNVGDKYSVKREGVWARLFRHQSTIVVETSKLRQGEPETVKQYMLNCIEDGTPIVVYYSENLIEGALGRHNKFTNGRNVQWMLSQLQVNSRRTVPTSKLVVIREKENMRLPEWMEKLAQSPILSLDLDRA